MDARTIWIIIALVSVIPWVVGGMWLQAKAKEEGIGRWALGPLGILYATYYGLTRWPDAKIPTILNVAGLVIFLFAFLAAPGLS